MSSIVCNLYIEDFQRRVLKCAVHPSCWWNRYVDDAQMVLVKIHAQVCTDNLNCIDDDIKWTTEGKVSIHTLINEDVNISTRTETAIGL